MMKIFMNDVPDTFLWYTMRSVEHNYSYQMFAPRRLDTNIIQKCLCDLFGDCEIMIGYFTKKQWAHHTWMQTCDSGGRDYGCRTSLSALLVYWMSSLSVCPMNSLSAQYIS
jgi:hypothetical protein